MPSKWDETSITIFLHTYKKYPCLWNPYHKNYYNCASKNDALQKIINYLNIPGYTITDYLHQITRIRKKYRKEQARITKGLQINKQYKSPYEWYDIMANMLAKVINDEEKAACRIPVQTSTHPGTRMVNKMITDNMKGTRKKSLLCKKLKMSPRIHVMPNNKRRKFQSVEKFYPCSLRYTVPMRHNTIGNVSDIPTKYIGLKESENSELYLCPTVVKSNLANHAVPLQYSSCVSKDITYERNRTSTDESSQKPWSISSENTVPCNEYKSFKDKKYAVCTAYTEEKASQCVQSNFQPNELLNIKTKSNVVAKQVQVESKNRDSKRLNDRTTRLQSSICTSTDTCPISGETNEIGTNTMFCICKDQSTSCTNCNSRENIEPCKRNFVIFTSEDKYINKFPTKSQETLKPCTTQDLNHCKVDHIKQIVNPYTKHTYSHDEFNIMKEDCIAIQILQLLSKILLQKGECTSRDIESSSPKVSNLQFCRTHGCTSNVKKSCSVDVKRMLKKIQEYSEKVLKLNLEGQPENRSIEDIHLNSNAKLIESQDDIKKLISAKVQTDIINTDASTMYEGNNINLASTVVENKNQQTSKDNSTSVEKSDMFSFADKEISTCLECCDVGTNGSLSKLSRRDMGIQSFLQLLNKSVSSAVFEDNATKKINIGTQKRDPLIVHVMKCNGQMPRRADKTTFIDENIKTCDRSNCSSYQRHSISTHNERKIGSPKTKVYKDQIVDSHYKQSLPYMNFVCDKNCKDKASLGRDWTDVTNINRYFTIANPKAAHQLKSQYCNYKICNR